ncbi:MAG: hypothetical protein HY247_08245 [archaeon]|nr:MAG: hypothetical protein HY247_08245 [archaeon]
MVRILWFKEANRWSRRGIPLRLVWVSPRQLVILFFSFLVGMAFSVPLSTATLKLIPVGSFLLVGSALAFWRVKMLTPEQLILVRLQGLTTIAPKVAAEKEQHLEKAPDSKEEPGKERAFRIEADTDEYFTPLSISGRWKRTKQPRKVSLFVDGAPRPGTDALATPISEAESAYTMIFVPTAADLGLHDLEVRIEGEEKPIHRVKVEVKVKGKRSLEMKKVS